MSDAINDEDAEKLNVALMPKDMLDDFRSVAKSGQVTMASNSGGKVVMGSQLLYPFYGGKKVPDETIRTPDYWFLTSVTLHRDAAQIGDGQSVVVIINATDHAVTVTRPYRDGGWMLGIPYDADNKANHIPGMTTMGGKDFFGVGAYINGIASIFYGSGAVLKLTAEGNAFPAVAVAYGSSINRGAGLGIKADISSVSNWEDWFDKTGDDTSFKAGGSLSESNSKVKLTASYAPWDAMDGIGGPLFTVLLENV